MGIGRVPLSLDRRERAAAQFGVSCSGLSERVRRRATLQLSPEAGHLVAAEGGLGVQGVVAVHPVGQEGRGVAGGEAAWGGCQARGAQRGLIAGLGFHFTAYLFCSFSSCVNVVT